MNNFDTEKEKLLDLIDWVIQQAQTQKRLEIYLVYLGRAKGIVDALGILGLVEDSEFIQLTDRITEMMHLWNTIAELEDENKQN